ncbi:hypothetical protein [Dictyobacter kobayashii]|uniref:Uncharacterized protein n=1 Tax=Dictyobacter kobayashii TaxID=2014872 RepID=A0A402AQN7_9CHLR|nr:hypothetical protein [Dictyobacter kobayashii]GCE21404.1 hypothetical protein KDK_52040 [Dictyobacter kobayashii]
MLLWRPMSDLSEKEALYPVARSLRRTLALARPLWLYICVWLVAILALLSGGLLLLDDGLAAIFPHAPISAAPLILIGAAYLAFQAWSRPKPLDLFKALIVCAAFILWGVDQLLPAGTPATVLGDIVITLYVIDLGWMIIERLRQPQSRHGEWPLPESE